ncbi:SDR family NAD(P)-dependent oxidoreductase [Campylobacter geochelonis]|uniref:SDR family NAD(P)-dependent oxidoreductase n=1 Tax=Campylobacter geochelonis TaxID=1780362 RepID=UPI0007706F40|nr:SDR family NAD(P)-dependent oxidoreductase [Campylobacter geochelonis]CZE47848.1 3-ketoacyl-(acyl-carrier-protein) reductase [Campylobacter geochelonis]
MRLKDKIAIITGGSSGIGAEICKLFVSKGAKVVVVSRHENKALMNQLGENAVFFSTDVSDEKSVEKLYKFVLDKFAKLDILVNNAGITGENLHTHELEFSEWKCVFDINVNGSFLMSKQAILLMMKERSGSIINISSVLGVVGSENFGAYCASKAAIIAMSKQDAINYAKYNIRVNSISPGTVMTELVASMKDKIGDEAFQSIFASNHPLGGVGEPKDVAYGALYLASDESKWVTGTNLVIDGGFLAR